MHALRDTDVPTAKMYALLRRRLDHRHFVLRDGVRGRANLFWNVQLPELQPARAQRRSTKSSAGVLAAIHSASISRQRGLSDYGRPDAYVARQVNRWTKQYLASKTADVAQDEHG